MAIRSSSTSQIYERHRWASNDIAIQEWVNDLVWKIMQGSDSTLQAPVMVDVPKGAAEVLREVIRENHLEGMVIQVFGDRLQEILGNAFYNEIEEVRLRNDLFIQEVYWLLGPKLGSQSLLVDDFAMRGHYSNMLSDAINPRFIKTLTLWTPTLATREDVISLLKEGGFIEAETSGSTYVWVKQTHSLPHCIKLCGTLWAASKNWVLDVEREIFDRAVQHSPSVPLRVEETDLFLLACRRYSIDSLCGSALGLLDLATLLARNSDDIDWDRLRNIKNAFHKPDWFWAAIFAVAMFEIKTGWAFAFPDWVRTALKEPDSFWTDFIASRINWANPDQRLIDFPRAFVKAAKGT